MLLESFFFLFFGFFFSLSRSRCSLLFSLLLASLLFAYAAADHLLGFSYIHHVVHNSLEYYHLTYLIIYDGRSHCLGLGTRNLDVHFEPFYCYFILFFSVCFCSSLLLQRQVILHCSYNTPIHTYTSRRVTTCPLTSPGLVFAKMSPLSLRPLR